MRGIGFFLLITVACCLADDDDDTGNEVFARLHALCMFVAWGICGTAGILISRYLKQKLAVTWFRLHIWLGIAVITLSVLGLILVLCYLEWQWQFDDTHHLIGFVVILGSFFQVIFGYLAHHYYQPQRKETPFWPDQVHWHLGLTLWVAAMINIILGLNMSPDMWPSGLFMLYWFFIAFLVTIFLFRKRPKEQYHETPEQNLLIPSLN